MGCRERAYQLSTPSDIIKSYLQQTVTVKHTTGRDKYALAQTVNTQVAARFEQGQRLIRKQDGEVVSGVGFFVVDGTVTVQAGDTINDGARDWLVLEVNAVRGLEGEIYYQDVHV